MNPQQTTSLSLETVRHIATLSRLHISADEELIFQKELEKVLTAFHALTQVPLPPDFMDSRSAFLLENLETQDNKQTEHISRMAADEPNNSLSTSTLMAQTPESEGVFVRVPAILNQEH